MTRGITTIATIKLEKFADRIAEVEAIIATANVVTTAKMLSRRVRIHSYFDISRDKLGDFAGKLGALDSEFGEHATTKRGHPSMCSAIVGIPTRGHRPRIRQSR